MRKNRPIVVGAGGSIGLLIIYFGILTWVNSLSHALEQFSEMWYCILILVIGFGIQLGLYSYIRFFTRKKITGATAEVATAGGISTGSINTHQGSLDFDLTKISHLEDHKGNMYQPLSWGGSSPGGHHRSGTLSFPRLTEKTKFIKLIIKNVYNVPERVFKWKLA